MSIYIAIMFFLGGGSWLKIVYRKELKIYSTIALVILFLLAGLRYKLGLIGLFMRNIFTA